MKKFKNKMKQLGEQCSICSAKFEIWLNNSRISDERREKMGQYLLSYCPACSRTGER
ncbi:MAG: hypothetical protein NTY04_00905 [Candidatus Staskawiczbacteria bacterium]|nr:hypothetical protein [Candidatus Staskawiczbacteria bacterium]